MAYKEDIWVLVFSSKKGMFRGTASHGFTHMVGTDGVWCCVVQVRIGPCNRQRAREKSIEELTANEKKCHSDKAVVGVDRGMGNLLYFSTEEGKKRVRYRHRQRRKETKVVKYNRMRKGEKERAADDHPMGSGAQ